MTSESTAEHILDRIVRAKLIELERVRAAVPVSTLEKEIAANASRVPGRFRDALLARRGGTSRFAIIAESKKASPSLGVIQSDYDAVRNALAYERAGASTMSVLTDAEFFQGSLDDLRRVKAATSLPVLRKDFTLDEYHIVEAAAAGADAVLLIVAILDRDRLRRFLATARSLNLDALVEVASRAELDLALEAIAGTGAATEPSTALIGVNNRDLKNFSVSLNTSLELIDIIPDAMLAVSESGLRTGADLTQLEAAGFNAFLIGERFMKQPDPGAALAQLLTESR
ncbi:MAG: indole-3-glycerol phosphate synthase TrpC [Acidobacteria bacterium]|nr:indole-3-glycerol phosphate synthase TrpC [Acidobacteriota bacterium]